MNNRCDYTVLCGFIGTILAVLAGIAIGALQFFEVLIFLNIPLIAVLIFGGIAFGAIAVSLIFTKDSLISNCLCRLKNRLLTGAVGSFLTALFALLLSLTAGSVFSAIVVGLVAFFIVLLISAIICLINCADDCE